jgi:hypothetical protein
MVSTDANLNIISMPTIPSLRATSLFVLFPLVLPFIVFTRLQDLVGYLRDQDLFLKAKLIGAAVLSAWLMLVSTISTASGESQRWCRITSVMYLERYPPLNDICVFDLIARFRTPVTHQPRTLLTVATTVHIEDGRFF